MRIIRSKHQHGALSTLQDQLPFKVPAFAAKTQHSIHADWECCRMLINFQEDWPLMPLKFV